VDRKPDYPKQDALGHCARAIGRRIPTARNPSNESKKQNIRGGTILTAGPGVKYDMLSANINATDAKEDGRNIKLSMAAALNMPEYIFGDASNANYASSLIAESPFVKAIQYWQLFFEYYFAQIFRRVIENAVKGGLLEEPSDEEFINKLKTIRDIKEDAPPPAGQAAGGQASDDEGDPAGSEDPNDKRSARDKALAELMPDGKLETPTEVFYGCDMDWPEIIHRDMKQHVDALTIARQNGWLADSTATSALGYDYPEEVRKQRQIEEEAAQAGNPLLGKQQGDISDDGNMDAEMQDALNSMTPEERNQIMNAKNPSEVFKIMSKKQTAAAAAAGAEGD
jgi:hypothetical protein